MICGSGNIEYEAIDGFLHDVEVIEEDGEVYHVVKYEDKAGIEHVAKYVRRSDEYAVGHGNEERIVKGFVFELI